MTIADAWINISTRIQGFNSGLKKAKKSFKNFSDYMVKNIDKIERSANSLNMVTGKLKWAILGLGGAVAFLGKSAVSAAGEMERYERQFKVLYGSIEAARSKLEEVTRFAEKTPFELPEVIQATRVMKLFGIETEDNLRTIGDASALATQPIQNVAMWIGRLASGNVGEAIMRLTEMGIITRSILEQRGIKFDRSGAYKGSVKKLTNEVMSYLKEKFGGGMEDMATSWEGMMSNLSDAWFKIRAEIGTVILPYLKDKLKSLLDLIDNWIESGKLEEYTKRIGEYFLNFLKIIEKTIKFVIEYKDAILSVVVALISMTIALKGLLIIAKIIKYIKKAGGVVAALNAILLANPIGIVVAAIGVLVGAVVYAVQALGGWEEAVGWVWTKLKQFWAFIKSWSKAVYSIFLNVGEIVKSALTFDFDGVKRNFEKLQEDWNSAIAGGFTESKKLEYDYLRDRFDRLYEAQKKEIKVVKETKQKVIEEKEESLEEEKTINKDLITANEDMNDNILKNTVSAEAYKTSIAWKEHLERVKIGADEVQSRRLLNLELDTIEQEGLDERNKIVHEEVENRINTIMQLHDLGVEQKITRLEELRDEHLKGSEEWKTYTDKIKELGESIKFSWKDSIKEISSMLASSLGNALTDMLTKSKSFASAMKSMWKDLKSQIISYISQMIAKWLVFKALQMAGVPTGFLPGFAEGGIAWHPQVANVAENEPEAIIPLSKLSKFLAGSDNLENIIPSSTNGTSGSGNESKNIQLSLSLNTSLEGSVIIADDDSIDKFYENVMQPAEDRFKKRIIQSIEGS